MERSNSLNQMVDYRVDLLHALADPVRLELIEFLRDGERCVCEILPAFEKAQSTISKHLDVLHNAGILNRRIDGKRTLYSIRDPEILHVLEKVDNFVLTRINVMTKVAETVMASRSR